eukprot:355982-Chlamydomonas_euryale.AAC.5
MTGGGGTRAWGLEGSRWHGDVGGAAALREGVRMGMCVVRVPSVYPQVKSRRGGDAQNVCRGRRSRPIMPAEAEVGLRPRTCTHVNGRGRRPRGISMHACPRPRAGRGRGRRDSPRSEAESSMFCARMTLPRFHKG